MRNFDRSYLREQLALRVFLLDGAERGRRGEHRDAAVLGDHAPERAGVGRADRLALVEDRGAAVQQRRIDDVAVADHPADVGGRPAALAGLDAVVVLHRPFQRDHVAAVVAHHALRDAGRAGGVEDVERIGGHQRHRLEHVLAPRPAPRPRSPASRGRGRRPARRCSLRALQDQAGLRLVPGEIDRLVEQRLVGDDAVDLDAAARRQDHLGLGVVDAGGELLRREAAEHHRMDRADARAGQHRDHRLRHHRHVEDDAVAFADAEVLFEDAGERLGLGLQRRRR